MGCTGTAAGWLHRLGGPEACDPLQPSHRKTNPVSTRSGRNPAVDRHRARVAGLTLHHGPDAPVVTAAKRELEAELLAAHIERVATQAPMALLLA